MKVIVKILAVVALVACVVTLFSACGNDEADDEDFCVTYKGVDIIPGKAADEVLNKLGTPKDKQYYGNCGGKGEVYEYEYNGFVLKILTANNKNTIDQIDFTDDTVSTSKGICIGNTSDEVVKAHGNPTEQTDSLIVYKKGSLSLQFTIKSGAVTGISYYNITE